MLKYWTAHILAGRRNSMAICLGAVLVFAMQGSCQQSSGIQSAGSSEANPASGGGQHAGAEVSTQPAMAGSAAPAQQGGLKNFGGLKPETAKDSKKQTDIGSLAWQTVGYTVLILILGGAVLIMAKRLLPKLGLTPASGRDVQILETLCLNSRQKVHLLKVGGRKILVASCRDTVSMLADVTEQAQPDETDEQVGLQVQAGQSAGRGKLE